MANAKKQQDTARLESGAAQYKIGSKMQKLTMEQAIVISAYTGVLICPFEKMQEAIEKKLNRPVFTHEMGESASCAEIKKAFRNDFIALAPDAT